MNNFSFSYKTTRKLKDIKNYISTRCGLLTITATLFLMLPDCIISFCSVIFCPVCSVWLLGDHKQFTWHKKFSASTAVLLLSSHVMHQVIIVQHHGSTRLIFIIRDYWNSGLSPSSSILKKTKEHNVSETWSLSVLRWRGGRHLLLWVHRRSSFQNVVFFSVL
jgi:hypothetical protein